MNCDQIRPLLVEYAAGTLFAAVVPEVEGHLDGCATCREELGLIRLARGELGTWSVEEPPPGLAERTLERLEKEGMPADGARRLRVVAKDEGARPDAVTRPVRSRREEWNGRRDEEPAEPIRWYRPGVTPIAAALLLVTGGYHVHLQQQEVRVAAHVIGNDQLQPGATSTLRVELTDPRSGGDIPAHVPVDIVLRQPGVAGSDIALHHGSTDAQGQLAASFQVPKVAEGRYELAVRAQDGIDVAEVVRPVEVHTQRRLLLAADKPVHQPGQTLHVRSLALEQGGRAAAAAKVKFSVLDPKGTRLFRTERETEAHGISSFDLPLDSLLPLGTYKVEAESGDARATLDVQVQRYVLPKVEVKASLTRAWVEPGERVEGTVDARWFFGLPVKRGKVRIELEPMQESHGPLAVTEVLTDEKGHATFAIEMPTYVPGVEGDASAPIAVKVEVTDSAGQRASKSLQVVVARTPLTVAAVLEGGLWVQASPNRLLVLVARPDGSPASGVRVVAETVRGEPSGTTDAEGLTTIELPPQSRSGELLLVAREGTSVRVEKRVPLTARTSFALVRPARRLTSAAEPLEVEFISASNARQAWLAVSDEGRILQSLPVALEAGRGKVTVQLPPEARGSVVLEASVLSGESLEVSRAVVYVADEHELSVEVKADAELHRPGEPITLELSVKDETGAAVAAGLGVSVVDESVFAVASQEPALLKAMVGLAEGLRAPVAGLEPLQIASEGKRQSAANFLFSSAEVGGSVKLLGATDAADRARRQQTMESWRQPRLQAALLVGLFLVGVLLEGALRRLLGTATRAFIGSPIGWVIMATAVAFLGAWAATGERQFASIVGLGVGVTGLFVYAVVAAGPTVRGLLIGAAAMLVLLTQVFGNNIRRVFGASVDALSTESAAPQLKGGGIGALNQKKFITDFAKDTRADDGRPAPAPAAAPKFEAKRDAALAMEAGGSPQKNRQLSIQVMRGNDEKPGAKAKLAAQEAPGAAPAAPAELTQEEKSQVRVRSWFPETLFWSPLVLTDAAGKAKVQLAAADSITTWRASALATGVDGRLGTGNAALRVFQEFFVEADLPVFLTVGDEVEVPIAVHNHLDQPQHVKVQIEEADWYSAISPRVHELDLAAHEVRGIPFRFKATQFGKDKPLTVYAVGASQNDAVKRDVEVRPAGIAFAQTANGTSQAGSSARIELPAEAIEGASTLELRLFPSTFSAVLDGIEGTLRAPHGCFEQTSSATYPNALVLRYLKTQPKASAALAAKAEGFLTTGWQRLLTFEVRGGGFEWFGRSPANQVLTAYGLLEFRDMAKVFPVDEEVLRRTEAWLASRQHGDGHFEPDAQTLADGLYRDAFRGSLSTTAYIAWALSSSGTPGESARRANGWLVSHVDEQTDSYTLALATLAVNATGENPSRVQRWVEELVRRSRPGREGSVSWEAGARSLTYGAGQSADIETTALVVQALLDTGRRPTADAGLKWLLAARTADGTWGSTQATVLALRVLLDAAGRATVPASGSEVTLTNARSGEHRTVKFTPEDADVVQRLDLTSWVKDRSLELSFTGSAPVSYQLTANGWRPRTPEDAPALTVASTWARTSIRTGEAVDVEVDATWNRRDPSGMVLLELPLPPGFDVETEALDALVGSGRIGRYEQEGPVVVLYVDRLPFGQTQHFTLPTRPRWPVKATAPAVEARLYYRPEMRAEGRAVELIVAER